MKQNDLKRTLQRLDPGILVALVICGLAVWPFISRSSLPQLTDAELHVFRLAELSRLIGAGEIFPRWAPNFYYGFGYPIFNYYAPLAYYLALIPESIPQVDVVAAVKTVFVAASLLGGLGVYGYTGQLWGRLPALVATAAYVYAPFIVFVDPHARGDLAEVLSFAVFPLVMWAMERLRTKPGAGSWLVSVALIALLVLSHNLMALVFAGILTMWCVWQFIVSDISAAVSLQEGFPRQVLRFRLILALVIGIGVAAFFWLTVALEQDAVSLGSLIGEGDNFDFRNHFLSLGELLSPAAQMDWTATEPRFVLGLGVVQWLLALIGIAGLLTDRVRRKKQAVFFALVTILLLVLMLPVSQPIWDTVPYMPFLQFPWRLLGPIAFALAVLSAAATLAIVNLVPGKAGRWVPGVLVGLIMVSSLPLIQVPPWPADFGPTTALRVVREELTGRWLGTTSTSDFVPATVDKVPGPESSLLADFTAKRPLDRVNRVTLPDGTTVISEQLSPLHFRYHVEGESEFLLRLFLFDFPGWEVTIDREEAASELGRPEGFIVIPMAAGKHIVEVSFGDTVERKAAALVSGLSAVLAIVYAIWLGRNKEDLPADATTWPAVQGGGSWELIVVTVAAIAIAGLNAMLIEPGGLLRLESPNVTALPASTDYYAELSGEIALIGYDAPETIGRRDSSVPFTAYWQALRPQEDNYQAFVHLVDDQGQIVAQSDALNPGEYPTENWPIDKYVRDQHELLLPAGLEAGVYRWSVGLWLAEEGVRLQVIDSEGQVAGDSIDLPTLLVVK